MLRGLTKKVIKYSMICLTHTGAASQRKDNIKFTKEFVCNQKKKTGFIFLHWLKYLHVLEFIIVRLAEVKLSGDFFNLHAETHCSTLILAHKKRKEKTRRDLVGLKE